MENGFRKTGLFFLLLAISSIARAQAFPTATQPLEISAFGAATGTWTGLSGGRNLGVTAGLDIGWKPFYGFYPAIEGRGTYPVDGGHVDSQKNALAGFKAARYYGRFHPYGDFLIGRDKIIYQNGGYPNPSGTLLYLDSVSYVFSYGGGLDLTLSDNLSLKVDAQIQHYGVPVTPSGHIYSKPVSIGLAYRFDFNHHIRYNADGQVKGYKPQNFPRTQTHNAVAANSQTSAADSNSASEAPASSTTVPSNNTPLAKPSPDTPASSQQPQ